MRFSLAAFLRGSDPAQSSGFAAAVARKRSANGKNSTHEDEEERRIRDEEPLGKAIFLGQERKLQRRKVRFKKMRKAYDIKGRQSQKEVDMECHSGSGNRASKSRQKPIVFTNELKRNVLLRSKKKRRQQESVL